jgi:hypothetical protein
VYRKKKGGGEVREKGEGGRSVSLGWQCCHWRRSDA